MSMNPLNDISAVYVREVFKPQLGKGGEKPSTSGAKKVEKGKDDPESSAKRIRQAVYDIRYRARREDVKLDQAYNQYMGHTTMTGPEKNAVKEKLGLGAGSSSSVSEETEVKKYQVRVKDKASGKSYVRMATREKINQLRANPNISSVEMTQYGTPYEGERKKGKQTASVTSGKGLDPVGREDKDIDNDGDHDKTDKYLLNRRKVRGTAISQRKVREEFSDWRTDLREVISEVENDSTSKIKEKSVKNKVVINPEIKIEMTQIANTLGGQLVETVELEEKTLTSAETKKREEIVKSMKKSFSGFKQRYGDRAKDVMYATATARAKEVAEEAPQMTGSAATANKIKQLKAQQSLLQKQQQLEKQKEMLAKTSKTVGEEIEVEEGFRTIPAGRQREAMMKRASNLTKQAMTPSKDYADVGDGGKGSPREKAGKINDALRNPKLRKEEADQIDEADSIAAMQARREKRLAAQRKREGRPSGGGDFGHDYSKSKSQNDAEIQKRMKAFINKEEYVDEAITSEKGKAKAAEMIAKRSTASGRAKPGQGASVDRIKHISRANVDGYGGTPPNQKVAKNPVKSNFSGLNTGTGNKAAKRASALRKEESENLDELNRLEREQGKKSGGSSDPAYRAVKKTIRGMEGKPVGQQKKVPGKKPAAAGQYGAPASPAQKVAARRAAAQRAQDTMHSPRD